MKENISMVTAVLAIIISIIAVTSGVFLKPVSTLGASSVGENELADNSVTCDKIVDGAITDADISSAGISKIADNAITINDLSSAVFDAITDAAGIMDSSITSEKIVNGTITNVDVNDSANIDPSKISGTAWTSTNDGLDSGLDADKLDGIDSGKFLRNDMSGTITGDLTVDGTITHQAETRYYTIPACSFSGRDHDTPYRYYGQGFSIRNMDPAYDSHDYYASVNLPHGAAITKVTVRYSMTDSLASGSFTFYKTPYNSIAYEILQHTTASENLDITLSETVDNDQQAYYVKVTLDPHDGSNDLSIEWVCFTYTVTNSLS